MPLPGGQLLAATPKRQGEWVGVYTHDDENGRYILDRKSHTVNWTRQEKEWNNELKGVEQRMGPTFNSEKVEFS